MFGWLEALGVGGHALLLGAGAKGCLECLFLEADGSERLTAWSDFAASGQDFSRQHAGCGGTFTPFADRDARRTAGIVAELAAKALDNQRGPGELRSWLGASGPFTTAGFSLSKYARCSQHERDEIAQAFAQPRCPVCAR